jgi:hypothetical protein
MLEDRLPETFSEKPFVADKHVCWPQLFAFDL